MEHPTTAGKMLREELEKAWMENKVLKAELEYANKALHDLRERYIEFLATTNKALDLLLSIREGDKVEEEKMDAMVEKALKRPRNYPKLSHREQWAIDKRLGLLDWDGPTTDKDRKMLNTYFNLK